MIVVNLKGGLGNQMFQYALGYHLAKNRNTELRVDLRYLRERASRPSAGYVVRHYDLDIFGIEPSEATQTQLVRFGLAIGDYRVRFALAKVLDRLTTRVMAERTKDF